MCTQATLSTITNKVVKAARDSLGDKLDKVILYGSYACGDYDGESDIDIMVIADIALEDRNRECESIHRFMGDLDLEYDVITSISVADCKTFYQYANDLPFYMNVLKEGVTLSA